MVLTTPPLAASLDQLEGFLKHDPDNAGLRSEAFDTALRAGLWDRAEAHLQQGLTSGQNPLAWRLRAAHLAMARHDWAAASGQLEALRVDPAAPPELVAAALQDDAYVALRSGQYERGLLLLEPLVQAMPAASPALQTLWLRLQHHAGRLAAATQWATAWARTRQLTPPAAGVASLVALDAGDLDRCKAWADQALRQDARQAEALVARAHIALVECDGERAASLLETAASLNPSDGRTLSALAFSDLQLGRLVRAREQFERATAQMPGHIGTWHGLGWTALLQRDLPAAQAAFEQALALDRNFAESHGGMAVVLARRGERAAAEAAIERSLRLDRQAMSAHYARAVLDGTADDAHALQAMAQRLLRRRLPQTR